LLAADIPESEFIRAAIRGEPESLERKRYLAVFFDEAGALYDHRALRITALAQCSGESQRHASRQHIVGGQRQSRGRLVEPRGHGRLDAEGEHDQGHAKRQAYRDCLSCLWVCIR
ncbi:hypothetical protein, partial [Arhodomonas sp. KWT]|uniref:hypothetical protein n=1 Tax=Arhodomonas sp. KWT TaxID=2679915 RepID=UPI001969A589